MFGSCCTKAHVKHEDLDGDLTQQTQVFKATGHKPKGPATAQIAVRTFTDSSGGATDSAGTSTESEDHTPLSCSSSDSSSSNAEWHDCVEEWGACTSAAGFNCQPHQAEAEADSYAGLPAELTTIVKSYQQGRCLGCKPAVALIKYMEASGTSLQQLQELLAHLLLAEQAARGGCKDAPVPTPHISPLSRTQSLRSGPAQQQRQQSVAPPSLARLLDNVALVHKTLAGMAIHSQDGFKQVASGNLELWYKHDTARHCQVIRARTILDEPVEHAVCLAREVDLVTSWNPAIADMRELGSYSPSELLVYMLLWVPWPLFQPEVVNYAVGLDLLDTQHEAVFIGTKNGADMLASLDLPAHPRAQRLTMNAGGFLFKPLPPHPSRPSQLRMEAVVLVSIDATKWLVPDAIISFVLKVFAPLVYKSVIKVLQRMFHSRDGTSSCSTAGGCSGSALLERLEARPEYAAISVHAQKYLAAQARAQAELRQQQQHERV